MRLIRSAPKASLVPDFDRTRTSPWPYATLVIPSPSPWAPCDARAHQLWAPCDHYLAECAPARNYCCVAGLIDRRQSTSRNRPRLFAGMGITSAQLCRMPSDVGCMLTSNHTSEYAARAVRVEQQRLKTKRSAPKRRRRVGGNEGKTAGRRLSDGIPPHVPPSLLRAEGSSTTCSRRGDDNGDKEERYAFVVSLCNTTDYYGSSGHAQIGRAINLVRSLHAVGSTIDAIAFVHGYTSDGRALLADAGWRTVDVSHLHMGSLLQPILAPRTGFHFPRRGRVQPRADGGCTALKFLAWNLTQCTRHSHLCDGSCAPVHDTFLPLCPLVARMNTHCHWLARAVAQIHASFTQTQTCACSKIQSHGQWFMQGSARISARGMRMQPPGVTTASMRTFYSCSRTRTCIGCSQTAHAPHRSSRTRITIRISSRRYSPQAPQHHKRIRCAQSFRCCPSTCTPKHANQSNVSALCLSALTNHAYAPHTLYACTRCMSRARYGKRARWLHECLSGP